MVLLTYILESRRNNFFVDLWTMIVASGRGHCRPIRSQLRMVILPLVGLPVPTPGDHPMITTPLEDSGKIPRWQYLPDPLIHFSLETLFPTACPGTWLVID